MYHYSIKHSCGCFCTVVWMIPPGPGVSPVNPQLEVYFVLLPSLHACHAECHPDTLPFTCFLRLVLPHKKSDLLFYSEFYLVPCSTVQGNGVIKWTRLKMTSKIVKSNINPVPHNIVCIYFFCSGSKEKLRLEKLCGI